MPDGEEANRREIEALRAWRHDKVVPELVSLRGRLQVLEARVAEIEPQVEKMASQAKIQAAVSAALRQERGQWLTGGQKAVAYFGAVVLFGIAVADFVRPFFT